MTRLQEAVESKAKGEATVNSREGALQAYECLAGALGRLFEPYVITILPLLLTSVADTAGPVRHAATRPKPEPKPNPNPNPNPNP